MKEVTTITEVDILYAALTTIRERWNKEYDRCEELPGNQLTQARLNKLTAQYDEIHARILDLESAEQH